MRRVAVAAAALAACLAVPVLAVAGGPTTDGASVPATVDSGLALVQLNGDPLATYEKTRPAPGKKIDFDSNTVKSYRAKLAAQRNDFKRWLRANAKAAKVTGEFDVLVNAVGVKLNGVDLGTIRSAPMVASADLQGIYRPMGHGDDPDLALINAIQAWGGESGAATAGAGVKVAIVDSGIDVGHPCFADAHAGNDGPYTNDKVVFADVFHMEARVRGYTPADENGHGTHVAGTVACNFATAASVQGVTIPYGVSGVAPAALLGNFNVFPGAEGSARSEDILDALEEAAERDFDVVNMSLGGPSSGIRDLLTMAVDNLDRAGIVSAVAAGNSGPGHYTVESPGMAERALTAGASTVPHFVGSLVRAGGATYDAAVGDFDTVESDLTAPLAILTEGATDPATGLSTACSGLSSDLSGKIALLSRGACTFTTKVRNAENAGAAAVLVVNNVAGDPIAMAHDGTDPFPTIPAYMLARDDGLAIKAAAPAEATITEPQYVTTGAAGADIMAGFSSQGPTDVDFRIKPDVVAPGVNVLSAQPAWVCGLPPCWAFFQGTSMATPHLAGSAAFLIGLNPDWSAAQVRSAIVNTANQDTLKSFTDGSSAVTDPNVEGAGRQDLLAAKNAQVALDPVSVSFGSVPSGSGQTLTKTVALSHLGEAAVASAEVSGSSASGVTYDADLDGMSIVVTMSAEKGAEVGDHNATLILKDAAGDVLAHAAVYTFVKEGHK